MKVIIAGGRNFFAQNMLAAFLNDLLESGELTGISEVVCGGAKGADAVGAALALQASIPVRTMEADWRDLDATPCKIKTNQYGEYNVLAGMNRNIDMGDYADALVAAWDCRSAGTKQMIDYMQRIGKPVFILEY